MPRRLWSDTRPRAQRLPRLPSTKRPALRKPKLKPNIRQQLLCRGGPYYGRKLWVSLQDLGTMVFVLGGQRGRYARINADGTLVQAAPLRHIPGGEKLRVWNRGDSHELLWVPEFGRAVG